MSQAQLTKATGYRRSMPMRLHMSRAMLYTGFILLTVIFIMPVVWLFLTSLKLNSEYGTYPTMLFPALPQWSNYPEAIIMRPFLKLALNTLEIALPSAVLTVLSSSLAGFAFARMNAPGKAALFILVLSMLLVPRMVTTIPDFILFSKLNLTNTYWPWILWGISGSSFNIFLFRQFFAAVPKDLEDAAEVDGCSRFRIFWQIFLPVSGPVIATALIFHFQWVWGDWFTPNILLSANNTTLAVGLGTLYLDPKGMTLFTLYMAALVCYLLPMLIIFVIGQKYIVQGIVTTGIKG
jgi:multiple sugar transport system permease protein